MSSFDHMKNFRADWRSVLTTAFSIRHFGSCEAVGSLHVLATLRFGHQERGGM